MPTTEEAVAAIADAMGEAEDQAGAIRRELRKLKDEFEAIHVNGDAGYLATKGFATELDALATQFEAALFDIHQRMTIYAQARGIDLPSPLSGGGR